MTHMKGIVTTMMKAKKYYKIISSVVEKVNLFVISSNIGSRSNSSSAVVNQQRIYCFASVLFVSFFEQKYFVN
jgi:hypothetical protein